MITLYCLIATGIAILHSLVALYMLSILFCVFKRNLPRWYLKIQTAIIGISCITNLVTGVCPLTFFENKFRALGGEEVYKGNFLNHYFIKFFNVSLSDQLVFRSIVLFMLLLIFMIITRRVRFSLSKSWFVLEPVISLGSYSIVATYCILARPRNFGLTWKKCTYSNFYRIRRVKNLFTTPFPLFNKGYFSCFNMQK